MSMGVVAPLFLLTRFTYLLNYVNFDMATEYPVYAHDRPILSAPLREIDLISERTAGERNVVVAYDDESSAQAGTCACTPTVASTAITPRVREDCP